MGKGGVAFLAWGSGALDESDLRLLEAGSKRGGALGSNVVEREAVQAMGRCGNGERVAVAMSADVKAGGGALQ